MYNNKKNKNKTYSGFFSAVADESHGKRVQRLSKINLNITPDITVHNALFAFVSQSVYECNILKRFIHKHFATYIKSMKTINVWFDGVVK